MDDYWKKTKRVGPADNESVWRKYVVSVGDGDTNGARVRVCFTTRNLTRRPREFNDRFFFF